MYGRTTARLRERERRERQKQERRLREREAEEERKAEEEVKRRLTEGDLREKVVAKVVEQLRTEEVQKRIAQQTEEARAKKLKAGLDAIETGRRAKVSAAKQKEEDRLSEARQLQDILRENERKVNAERRRREEEERQARRDREAQATGV